MAHYVSSIAKENPGELIVPFQQVHFENAPTVIVTSFLKKSGQGPTSIETITEITSQHCKIYSEMSGPEYFVNVLAIESPLSAGFNATFGQKKKPAETLEINYAQFLTSPDPSLLISPFWENKSRSVDFVDTIDDNAASEAKIISNNHVPDFWINYFAMDLGITKLDGKTVQAGIVNKTDSDSLRVYFPESFQTAAPIVFLSPWLNDLNQQTGCVQTLNTVNQNYFEMSSCNGGKRDFVTWVAFE